MIISKTELIINDSIKYIVVEDIDENYINLYGVDKNFTSVENNEFIICIFSPRT